MFVLIFLFQGIIILAKISYFDIGSFQLLIQCSSKHKLDFLAQGLGAGPGRSVCFVAFPESWAPGLCGPSLWICAVPSSFEAAWSLPALPKSRSSCWMQIVGFSSSGFALCLHEIVLWLEFPGEFYCHSVHFPFLGFCFTLLHMAFVTHTCSWQASLWMISSISVKIEVFSILFSYLPCCFYDTYKRRGLLCLAAMCRLEVLGLPFTLCSLYCQIHGNWSKPIFKIYSKGMM